MVWWHVIDQNIIERRLKQYMRRDARTRWFKGGGLGERKSQGYILTNIRGHYIWLCGGWYHWKADVISFNLMPNSWLFIIWISFNQSKQIKAHQIIVVFWEPQINRVITWCVNGIDTNFKRVGCEVMCAEPHWCRLQHAKYGTDYFRSAEEGKFLMSSDMFSLIAGQQKSYCQ